jgi:hypothetical protein
MIGAFIVIIIIILILIILFWWFWVKPQSNVNVMPEPTLDINDIIRKKANCHMCNKENCHMCDKENCHMCDKHSNGKANCDNMYNGNINDKINYINHTLKTHKYKPPINVLSGHTELNPDENNNVPYGIPYNRTNISAPANPPYKESNNTTIDYDEQNTYQGLGRNDPYRPINGIMNRKKYINPYLIEELEREERKEWWGNGEV